MGIRRTIEDEVVLFEVNQIGRFVATIGDDEVSATTLADAEEQAKKLIKKQRAALRSSAEITVLSIKKSDQTERYVSSSAFTRGEEAIDFTARGYTERTRELLVTTLDGKKEKLDKHAHGEEVVRRLTRAEHDEYAQLMEQLALAKRAIETFKAARVFDWRKHFDVGVKRG